MSSIIQPNYGARTYSVPTKALETKRTGTQASSFLDMAARISRGTTDVLELSSTTTEATNMDAYMDHLKSKYGRVTIESIGKDQASLQKVGQRMSGNSVVIAPNILEEMTHDPQKAAYYEQKIDNFFNATPILTAQFAAKGLVYEPCGVVVHEDGSVTYIGGCSDSPERVAEVNRINREQDTKKAERRHQYQKQATAAAVERKAMWERIAQAEVLEESFSSISDLLKTRMVPVPTVTPVGTNMFFLNL